MTKKDKIIRLLKITTPKRKYTFEEIAEKMEVSKQYVYQVWESNVAKLPLDNVK